MKIVRIIARLNVGGPARHVAWLTAHMRDAGHESVLVAGTVPPGEEDMSYFASALGVEPLIIPEMSREISPKDALTIWKLYRLFVRLKPDIVHTHTAKAGTTGRLAGMLYRWLTPSALVGRPRACRFVHTYHGHVFHSYYGPWKTRFFLTVEKILARCGTDRIIVISPQQRHEIHETFGVGRAGQFAVIPLGLETEIFAHWRERRRAARAGLGVTDDRVLLVGLVGRLTEIKNHQLFLEAATIYKKKYDVAPWRVRFVVIGDGHLRRELESYARATLRLSDEDLIFTGARRDPENFYAALDMVALTSLNEGTPLTLIEAMANERAVIATAVGGVVDLLGNVSSSNQTSPPVQRGTSVAGRGKQTASGREEGSGFVVCERGVRVRAGDAAAFSEGLARLVEDVELRQELGARGRSFVEQHYGVARLVSDMLQLYDEMQVNTATREKNEDGTGHTEEWVKGKRETTSTF